MKQFFNKHTGKIIRAVLIILTAILVFERSGFAGLHILAAVLATAAAAAIISYHFENKKARAGLFKQRDFVFAIIISIATIIIGCFYWNTNNWIAFAGFTVVFYLIFFGYGFVYQVLKKWFK